MEEISNKTKIILIALSLIPIIAIIFFGGLIIVNAQTQMQTFELNHFWAGNETPHTIYSSTNTLKNYGRGYLTFSFAIYRYGENTSFTIPTLSGVNVNTGDAIWACNVGTTSNDFSQDDVLKVNFYTAVCDVNIGSQGIRTINLELALLNNNWNIKTSQFATFTNDVSMDIYTYLSTINSTIANYIGTTNSLIASKIDSTNAYLSVIQNILNTNIPAILTAVAGQTNAINNQTTTINNNHNELMDTDIDSTTKQNVDTTSVDDYNDAEADIMNQVGQADLTSLSIGIDRGTSSTIWNLITRIIQSNTKIFGLFISILSIGIIKIALAR